MRMVFLFTLISSATALYVAVLLAAIKEAEQEEVESYQNWIERAGGINSPWLNPESKTSPSDIPDLVEVFPRSHSAPESVPAPRPSAESGLNHVEPGGSAVRVQDFEPVHEPVQPAGSADWLEKNAVHFPLEVPPELITDKHGLWALEEAQVWIRKALRAGVSQTKIATEMFGCSKGGNKAYLRIVNLVKDCQR